MPPGWITLDCPCCPGGGGGGSFETEVWDCLDLYALDCGPACPGNVMAKHWCMTFNTTGPDSGCGKFRGFSLQADGDGALCAGQWLHSTEAECESIDPADWCASTGGAAGNAEVSIGFVTAGGAMAGGEPAPACGFFVRAVVSTGGVTSNAYYFIDLALFNCTGPNTLDLIAEIVTGGVHDEGWPATITITPCADDGCP